MGGGIIRRKVSTLVSTKVIIHSETVQTSLSLLEAPGAVGLQELWCEAHILRSAEQRRPKQS